ncbi:unnamed protein product [Owenia fusiformis]|uniref:Uncharacterized protein n=1 Tax=Owenia fusiformis TaxID=6347 RepID=A0A8J1U7C8_OWEFU|nr:unnamed protein product [Owenia fusiformis]
MADQGSKKATKKLANEDDQLLPFITSYFKNCGLVGLIFGAGYFNFSIAWPIFGLLIFMWNEKRKRARQYRIDTTHALVKDEKATVLARVDELPSWVFYPDIERAEWVNNIIGQLWPFIGDYVKKILVETVQPQVKANLPSALKSFAFETIDLGDIPPRIGGVKVYTEHVSRDEIVMDLEIYYASDAQVKVNIKNITAGIKELQIHGTMRVVMSPLIPVSPLIGGITVFFLNPPSVEFNSTDLGNVLDIPGLSDIVRNIIEDQIAAFLVLPNRIPVQLAEGINLQALRFPTPQGVLRMHIIGARDLKRADIGLLGKGKSDPYAVIHVGAQKFKTKVIPNTVTPGWNTYFEAIVDQRSGQFFELEIKDEDPGEDDRLGSIGIEIASVADKGEIDSWMPLGDVETGMVHVCLSWLHLTTDPTELYKVHTNDTLCSCVILVYVDSAANLPRSRKTMAEPSSYVILTVGQEEKVKTPIMADTNNPRYEKFYQFLVKNPQVQDVDIEIRDKKGGDKKIGSLLVPMKQLLSAPGLTLEQPFRLQNSGPQSTINLKLALKILSQNPQVLPPDEGTDVDSGINIPTASDNSPASTPVDQPESPSDPKPTPSSPEPRPLPPTTLNNEEEAEVETLIPEADMSLESQGGDLRHRSVGPAVPAGSPTGGSGAGVAGLGKIQLTIRYSTQRSRLVVVIHKCVNLIPCDDDNLADPYVRIRLMPDKSSKKKTETIKNQLDPIFDETFEFNVNQAEASQRQLDIAVKNSVGLFSGARKYMGTVLVDLNQFDLTKAVTEWFDLEEPEDKD